MGTISDGSVDEHFAILKIRLSLLIEGLIKTVREKGSLCDEDELNKSVPDSVRL